jgi:hypothetical protein
MSLICLHSVYAQTKSEADEPITKAQNALKPGSRPDTFFLRNEKGEGIAVPAVRYEDFERFLEGRLQPTSSNASTSNASTDVLDRIDLTIFIEKNLARLQVEGTAKLSDPSQGWRSIQLGMGGVQIIPSVNMDQGQTLASGPPLRMSSVATGYEWRIAPSSNFDHKLRFDAVCNVMNAGLAQSLRLDLPSASAVIKLKLPAALWDLSVGGTGSEVIEPFREIEGISEALVRTSGGPILLTWTKKLVQDQVQAIEVKSETSYLPSPDVSQFRATSKLDILGPKSLGGRRFIVTLPKHGQWRDPTASSSQSQGMRISRASPNDDSTSTSLSLEFDESVSRTDAQVILEWQQAIVPDSGAVSISIPKVDGVQRHTGRLDVTVAQSVRFSWEPQTDIQFIRQISDGDQTMNYSFEIKKQSQSLSAKWLTNDRRSKVKGNYLVTYHPSSLLLNGTIEVLEDVRLLPFLQFETKGWTIEKLQFLPSGALVESKDVEVGSPSATESVMSVPLSLGDLLESTPDGNNVGRSAPSNVNRPNLVPMTMPNDTTTPTAQATPSRDAPRPLLRGIAFSLRRNLENQDIETPTLAFSLPMLSWLDPETQSRKSVCAGGELIIQSSIAAIANPKVLHPSLIEDSRGSIHDSKAIDIAPIAKKSTNGNFLGRLTPLSTLYYQVKNSDQWIGWSSTAQLTSTHIVARLESNLTLNQGSIDGVFAWRLNSQGPAPRTLGIAIDRNWFSANSSLDRDSVRLTYDGFPVVMEPLETAGNLADRMHFQFSVSGYAQSNLDEKADRVLILRTSINPDNLTDKSTPSPSFFELKLPTLQTQNQGDSIVLERSSGTLRFRNDANVQLINPASAAFPASTSNDPSILSFDCTQREARIAWEVHAVPSQLDDSIDVDSAWLQTIRNAIEERERFVFRFKTRNESISLVLPASQIARSKVLLNGMKGNIIRSVNRPDILEIKLRPDSSKAVASQEDYVLELFTWLDSKSDWITRLTANLPKIEKCDRPYPVVWQVVVPSTTSMISSTAGLSASYRWRWQDLWSNQISDIKQDILEKQMGASAQPWISQSTNQYLFYSLNQNASMGVMLVPRYLLWMPVALFVLLVAMSAIELRWIRNPMTGVIALLGSFSLSMFALDFSIAIGQCMLLSVAIALFYSLLKWIFDRRSRRRSVFASRTASGIAPSLVATGILSGSSHAMHSPAMVRSDAEVMESGSAGQARSSEAS